MRKWIFLLFLPVLAWGMDQPPFQVKDPATMENFRQIYSDVDQLSLSIDPLNISLGTITNLSVSAATITVLTAGNIMVVNSASATITNLNVSTLTTLSQILAEDGTISLPAYSFALDHDTGIWRRGTNWLSFVLGGVEELNLVSGYVTPNNRLAVNSDGTEALPSYVWNDHKSSGFWMPTSGSISVSILGVSVATFTSGGLTTRLQGTTTNDSAATGYIGEYISSACASKNMGTSGQNSDIVSITLTAGDWDVSSFATFAANGATVTNLVTGIGTVTGNSFTGEDVGSTRVDFSVLPTVAISPSLFIPVIRKSLSGTTTLYLKGLAEYTAAIPKVSATFSARRVR